MEASTAASLSIAVLGFILSYMGFMLGDGIGIYLALDAVGSILSGQVVPLLLGLEPYIRAAAFAVGAVVSVIRGSRRGVRGALLTLSGFIAAATAGIAGLSLAERIADLTLAATPFILDAVRLYNLGFALGVVSPAIFSAGVLGGAVAVMLIGVSNVLAYLIAGAFTGLHYRIHQLLEAAGVPRPWVVLLSIGAAIALGIVPLLAWVANAAISVAAAIALTTAMLLNIAKGYTVILAFQAITSLLATILTGLMISEVKDAVAKAVKSIGGRVSVSMIPIAFGLASVLAIAAYAPLLLAALLAYYLTTLLTVAGYITGRVSSRTAAYTAFTIGSMYWLALLTKMLAGVLSGLSMLTPIPGY